MNTPLALRFGEVAAALGVARDRLRRAVAEELGRAAGGALRDVLTGPARSVGPVRPPDPARESWGDDREWGEGDAWDDRPDDRDRYEEDPDEEPHGGGATEVPPAVAVGLGLWRFWLARSGSWRAALALGLAAGVTTLLGGPVVRAVLATLAAAAELLAPSPLNTRFGAR